MVFKAVIDFHLKPFFSRNFKGAMKKPSTYVMFLAVAGFALFGVYRAILTQQGIPQDARNLVYLFFGYLVYSLLTGRFENRFDESDAMPFFAMPVAEADGVTLVFLSKLFRQGFQTLLFCAFAAPAVYRFAGNWLLAAGFAAALFPLVWANEFLVMSMRILTKARRPVVLLLFAVLALEVAAGYFSRNYPLLIIASEIASAVITFAASRFALTRADGNALKTGFFKLQDTYKKRRGRFLDAVSKKINPYLYEVLMTETGMKKSVYLIVYGVGVEIFIFVMTFVMRLEPAEWQNYIYLLNGAFVFGAVVLSGLIENRDYEKRRLIMKTLGVSFGRFYAHEILSFAAQFIVLFLPAIIYVSFIDLRTGLLSVADFAVIPAATICLRIRFGERSIAGTMAFTFFAILYGVAKIGLGWFAIPAGAAGVFALYLWMRRRFSTVDTTY